MHKKSGIALILAGLLAGCAKQPGGLQGETLDLGDSQRVSRLFAYPNNCSVIATATGRWNRRLNTTCNRA